MTLRFLKRVGITECWRSVNVCQHMSEFLSHRTLDDTRPGHHCVCKDIGVDLERRLGTMCKMSWNWLDHKVNITCYRVALTSVPLLIITNRTTKQTRHGSTDSNGVLWCCVLANMTSPLVLKAHRSNEWLLFPVTFIWNEVNSSSTHLAWEQRI